MIHEKVQALVIAELEHEVTTIERITVNGAETHRDVVLRRGDSLSIAGRQGDIVELTGSYCKVRGVLPNPWGRNALIAAFLVRESITIRGASGPSRRTV